MTVMTETDMDENEVTTFAEDDDPEVFIGADTEDEDA